jgi:hypothetical protein
MLSTPRFIEEHDARNRRIYNYLHTKRGRSRVPHEIREELTFRSACSLSANNHFARVAFARAGEAQFRKLARNRKLRNFHFVTFIPRSFTMPLAKAGKANLNELRALVSSWFEKVDYFGIIEASYFSTGVEGERAHQAISWHVHMVVWNADREEVDAIVERINEGADPDLPPADAGHHGVDGAASRMVYIMKAPMDEHRVSVKVGPEGIRRRRKYARSIRTGNALDVSRLFSGKTIPELFVSAGQGSRLGERIIARAKRTLEADEDRHVANLERLLGHSHRRFRQS